MPRAAAAPAVSAMLSRPTGGARDTCLAMCVRAGASHPVVAVTSLASAGPVESQLTPAVTAAIARQRPRILCDALDIHVPLTALSSPTNAERSSGGKARGALAAMVVRSLPSGPDGQRIPCRIQINDHLIAVPDEIGRAHV